MATINLRGVPDGLRWSLKVEAAQLGIGIGEYCISVLKERGSVKGAGLVKGVNEGSGGGGTEKKSRGVSGGVALNNPRDVPGEWDGTLPLAENAEAVSGGVGGEFLPAESLPDHALSGTPKNLDPFRPVTITIPDKWPWDEMGASPIQNSDDRRDPPSDFQQSVDSAKEIANCPDCQAVKRHAYSDQTTPGFFYTECDKHRQPGIQGSAGVITEQEMTIEDAKRRFSFSGGGQMQSPITYGPGAPLPATIEGDRISPPIKQTRKRLDKAAKVQNLLGGKATPETARSLADHALDASTHPKMVNSPEDVVKVLPPISAAPRVAHAPGCKCLTCKPPKGGE